MRRVETMNDLLQGLDRPRDIGSSEIGSLGIAEDIRQELQFFNVEFSESLAVVESGLAS